MDWMRRLNPNGHTLESWMRETKYTGDIDFGLLKNLSSDRETMSLNTEVINKL